MRLLTRDDILSSNDLPRELISVPEWGGDVYVRGLSGVERDKFEASIMEIRGTARKVNLENMRAKLCALTICDDGGNLLFSDADVKELGKKSAVALTRVFTVAQRLSGLSGEDVEQMTKELENNPFDGSHSD